MPGSVYAWPFEAAIAGTATVAPVKADASSKLILGLENGQTWAQIDSTALKLKPGDQVVIRRGILGSFLLSRAGGGPEIRVLRR